MVENKNDSTAAAESTIIDTSSSVVPTSTHSALQSAKKCKIIFYKKKKSSKKCKKILWGKIGGKYREYLSLRGNHAATQTTQVGKLYFFQIFKA